MLDFARLRPSVDGWRGSFESLVCHLGKLNPPAKAREFRNIHGAGGDGGIEAYWINEDGSESGYQAKFYQRPGEIDWSSLDASIRTALRTHPSLTHVQVAVACDLTGAVEKGRGKPAWARWEEHREAWIADARIQGREVTFAIWTASDIEMLLSHPSAIGVRSYWFGEQTYSGDWFGRQFQSAVERLDDRYHPEDHVDVSLGKMFAGLRRTIQR